MKTIRSFIKTYITAFGIISLPFIILLVSSYLIPVNLEVIVYGFTFSFLSSFAIAYNFRKYEKSVIFTNENLFVSNLINSLSKLGYIVKDKTSVLIEFEPTVHSRLFAGKILTRLANSSATLEGSRLLVRRSLALTMSENKKSMVSNSVEECMSVWADEKKLRDPFPKMEDYLINSTEFEHAEEIMPEISAKMPEEV
ncbi:hypothetical protein SBF1_4540004 [Candidatus Desulfosporosinus infrequens]|uniref:Uncharacterized protein n=1 Tax=Candidatus Desulfosporosinus infrequens TaxID=2043169 RepID=A0A2U3LC95_9FIRM|nr:hypothetical protein SBF1_4540004 [Candidatus Desulfosporosinus infrequens]